MSCRYSGLVKEVGEEINDTFVVAELFLSHNEENPVGEFVEERLFKGLERCSAWIENDPLFAESGFTDDLPVIDKIPILLHLDFQPAQPEKRRDDG